MPLANTAVDHIRDAAQILVDVLDGVPAIYLDPKSPDVSGLLPYKPLARIRERLRLAYVALDATPVTPAVHDRAMLRRVAAEIHQRAMQYQPRSAGRAKWVDMAAELRALADRGGDK